MAWILLITAGVFEVGWALGLKYTDGFTNLIPTVLTIIAIIISMLLLGKSAQTISIGTAYPVWVGIGAVGAAIGEILLFKEQVTVLKMVFLTMLIISIIGLKLTAK